MPLSTLIEEVVAPHRDFDVASRCAIAVAGTPEPVGPRNPAILYGLGNIVENAVDFARTEGRGERVVERRDRRGLDSDEARAFAPEMLKRIGEPYVSRRRERRTTRQSGEGGLGLGLFIAKTLLERSGATVSIGNRRFPTRRAWSRSAGRATASRPSEIAARTRLRTLVKLASRLDQL